MENRLQRLTDDKDERRVFTLLTEAHGKDLTGTYTEMYQAVEQAIAEAIYFREAEDLIVTKVEKFATSQNFMQHIIH